jgi:hypothetical protein
MKILFSNPPWWDWSGSALRYGIRAGSRWPFTAPAHCRPDEYQPGGYLPFPFFMGYAASYARRHAPPQAQVFLRDSIALRESYLAYFQWLEMVAPDWIVIESATPSWAHDLAVIQQIDKILPNARVIVVGTITTDPARLAEATSQPNVAACVKGEYEKGVVRAILEGRQPPFEQALVVEHDLLTREEMNAAPFPLIPTDTATHYWDACPTGQRAPQLQVWSSRGCPYKCCFCAWPATMTGNDPDGTGRRSVRLYSPDYMSAFLTDAIARHGYQSIYDDSDTFNLVQKHTVQMCEVYARTGLPWSAMCRADTIDRDTWKLMRDSGCFGVKIGFESGSQRVVDQIVNKRLDLAAAADTARYLRSLGMQVHGTFTVGLPGERPEEAQQTIRFIEQLYADGAITTHQLSGTAEIEGTPLATLRDRGHLAAYTGAVMDQHYTRDPDGQHKIEQMRRS